jgi:DNA-binding NarL/FixJ family response regulator
MEKNNFQLSTFNSQLIRVAIIEDHKVVADGLERIINSSEIATVVGKAYSIAECYTLLEQHEVDLLLLDISLPDGSGIELCQPLKEKYPNVKILMLTIHAELSIIMRALEAGASGYILKNATTEEVLEGIRAVASGKQFLCNEVDTLLKESDNEPVRLSRREQELLRLIVAGLSNSEIAEKMFLGYETIKSYRKNLILKLNAHNTAQLVKMAIEQQLV